MAIHQLGDGVELHTRDEWAGASHPIRPNVESRDPRSLDEFIAHHSGGVTLGDPDPFQWARNIYAYHVGTLGYAAEAYEAFLAEHDNKLVILEGRPINLVSAATYQHNQRGFAACYLRANADTERDFVVPDLVKVGFRKLFQVTSFTAGKVLHDTCHADCKGDSTSCAGNDINTWVRGHGMLEPFGDNPRTDPGKVPPPPKVETVPPVTHPPLPPAAPFGPYPGTPLAFGSTGAHVAEWQQRLNALGAGLAVDGNFGRLTFDATRFFQATKGLSADGRVGPITWAAAR